MLYPPELRGLIDFTGLLAARGGADKQTCARPVLERDQRRVNGLVCRVEVVPLNRPRLVEDQFGVRVHEVPSPDRAIVSRTRCSPGVIVCIGSSLSTARRAHSGHSRGL